MDIGMIYIQVTGGTALVVRCEEHGEDVRLVPAVNAAELADQAARVVAGLGGTLEQDGLYISSDQLQAVAAFPPLPLPADAMGVGEAGRLLWPEASRSERWEQLKAMRNAGAVRVYRVGMGEGMRQFVSWGTVARLAGRDPAQLV
jgi:hypothetical protein